MTISNSTRTAGPFIGNGVTTGFPFSYKVYERSDLLVALTVIATSVETVLVLDSDYTVALNIDQNAAPGGVITMMVAPPVGTSLAATSDLDMTQTLDLTNQGGFYPTAINSAMDRVVIMIQQLSARIGVGALNVGAAAAIASVLNFITNLAGAAGSAGVGFLAAGVGAMLRSLQSKGRDVISVLDYGVVGDGVTNDTTNVQKAIDATPDGGTLLFPAGKTYLLNTTAVGPNDWWTADGEAALDAAYNTALAFRNRRNITIMAAGAVFTCPDEYTVTFYRCVNCNWIGGKFNGQAAYKAGALQAAAFAVFRCVNTWVRDVSVTTFYRNIWFGRSNWCGAEQCRSDDAGYLCYYASGNLDVTIVGELPFAFAGRTSDTKFIRCSASGGKYGNFFLENAEWKDCESFNPGRQGVQAYHVTTNNAGFKVMGGLMFDNSNQNSGDIVNGIGIAASGSYVVAGVDAVDRVEIGGGLIIDGGRTSIVATACSNVTIDNVTMRNFYLSGINAHTRDLGGFQCKLVNFNVGRVNVGPFKSTSTITAASYESKGAIVIEKNDGYAIQKAMVSGAVIDGNNAGAIAPTGTWYELKCNDSNVEIGDILIRGTGTQQRTAKHYSGVADHDISVTGTQAVTGIGFKPKKITVMACFSGVGLDGSSHGQAVGVGNARVMYSDPSTLNWATTANGLMFLHIDATNYGQADLTSFDDDGFTVTWAKTGTPTGIVRFSFICER